MTFEASFFRRNPLYWPVARAAATLEGSCRGWPEPDDLTRLFDGEPPVRFEPAAPMPRRRRLPAEARYDARIALARRVPTRARSWHDLSNALVWAAFPRAKLALHLRQHRAIAARLGADLRLPGARTREQDALAMLDEGGAVVLCRREHGAELSSALARGGCVADLVRTGRACVAIFGHAIYEAMAAGPLRPVRAAAYLVEVGHLAAERRARVAAADTALAGLLAREASIDRADLASLVVDERLAHATRLSEEDPAGEAGGDRLSLDSRATPRFPLPTEGR